MNIIDAAIECGVQKVIALSTDKAVNPVNLYGATKLCSDKLFVAGNVYVGARGYPKFAIVRYGNVMDSRGSIIPLWSKMILKNGKALPITDPSMTRFWITLDQAVDFVIESISHMNGGEIFIPKIPSIKIVDLAEAMAPGMPHHIIGIAKAKKCTNSYLARKIHGTPWNSMAIMSLFLKSMQEILNSRKDSCQVKTQTKPLKTLPIPQTIILNG